MHTLGNLVAFAAWVVLGLIGRHAYRVSHRSDGRYKAPGF